MPITIETHTQIETSTNQTVHNKPNQHKKSIVVIDTVNNNNNNNNTCNQPTFTSRLPSVRSS